MKKKTIVVERPVRSKEYLLEIMSMTASEEFKYMLQDWCRDTGEKYNENYFKGACAGFCIAVMMTNSEEGTTV